MIGAELGVDLHVASCDSAAARNLMLVIERCHLRVEDIDSQRMVIHVRAGKGGKGRLTVLSPRLLEVLRAYWRLAQPSVWLFPGATPARPVALDTARSVFHRARVQAGLPDGYRLAVVQQLGPQR